jgi:succinoglycan biosynthesis transport protein ExoP
MKALRDTDRDCRAARTDQPPWRELDVKNLHRDGETSSISALQFETLIGILRRRLGLILKIATLGTLLASAIALLIPPKYTAKAQIMVEPQRTGAVIGEADLAPPADLPAINTQVTMLTSHAFLRRVFDDLYRDPEFRNAPAKKAVETGRPASQTSEEEIPARPVAVEMLAGTPAAKGVTSRFNDFVQHLEVSQERSSRIIAVSFTSTSAKRAAIVANRVAERYIENRRRQIQGNASLELARLDERIAELKNETEWAAATVQASIQQSPGSEQAGDGDGRALQFHLRELEHETAARDQLQENLLRRQKEIRYRQEFVDPGVRIVSLASPPRRPSSRSPFLVVFPAFIMFSMGGCALARFMERFDRGIRSEQQINDALELPCLGLVPQLSRIGRYRPHKYVMKHPFTTYTEAIRSIVVALQLAKSHSPAKIVLISSSVPSEGKTTLAVSLAAYLALCRRRVVLVDLDFRRPMISRTFRARAKRGVLDALLDDLPPAEVAQHIRNPGLDYLPTSRCPLDPMTLFANGRLSRLLYALRESYDCVIVDGPPLMSAAEARLLVKLADKVLFVVKWDSTKREVAQNAVKLLRDAGCFDNERITHPAAVVTQVNLKEHARYRYGDVAEYFKEYGRYYSQLTGYPRATNL